MSSQLCQPSSEKIEQQKAKMHDLAFRWATKYPNIAKRYGGDFEAIDRSIKTLAESWLEIPYRETWQLTDYQWNLLEQHSSNYNKRLGKNWRASIVPEQTSLNDPTVRKFYTGINNITNYERHQLSSNHQNTVKTQTYLRESYIDSGLDTGVIGIKTLNNIRKLQNKILKTDSEEAKILHQNEINKLWESDEGKILRDFTHLNSLNDRDYNIVKKYGQYRDPNSSKNKAVFIDVNKNTLNAVTNSRKHLNELGKVAIDSMDQMMRLIKLKYDYINGDVTSNSYKNLLNKYDEAKQRVVKNRKSGGYMPTRFLDSLIDMKIKSEDFMKNEDIYNVDSTIDQLSNVLSSINAERLPNQLKPRNELIQNTYDKDPLYVIDQYGKELASFNKLTSLQRVYLDAMKDLPNLDTKFMKGMRQFIEEEFYIASRGLSDRPEMFNKINGQISAGLTASTMSLNPTGAIKNTTSLVYYYAEQGVGNLRKARKMLKEDSQVMKALESIQQEQGFKFPDAALDLIAEGMVPEGTTKSDIVFNPETGEISVKGKNLMDMGDVTRWGIDKLLFIHKFSENFTRKHIFNTSFALKYRQLIDNPNYMSGLSDGEVKNIEREARNFSKTFALNTVNLHAYEYALHSKPKVLRGMMHKVDHKGNKTIWGNNKFIAGAKGAAQQHGMSLFMYPMSLFGTHIRKAKGATNELLAMQNLSRDFKDMKDVRFFLKYAAAYGMVNLASIAMNINLHGMVDFDTINKLKEIDKNLHTNIITDEDSEENLYGLLGQLTGAGVGKLSYLLQTQGIINTDRSRLEEILFGNVDYTDPEKERLKYYQYATVAGNMVNKYIPSFKNGDGVGAIRHLFKFYPSKWTKKWNEKFLASALGVEKAKKAPKRKLTTKEQLNRRALKAMEAFYG